MEINVRLITSIAALSILLGFATRVVQAPRAQAPADLVLLNYLNNSAPDC